MEIIRRCPFMCSRIFADLGHFSKKSIKEEICIAGSRVYVQEGIYDEFVKKVAESAKKLVVGDPFRHDVHRGPQVDKAQFEKFLKYIDLGMKEGTTFLTGGKTCGKKWYYIEPTIFIDVKEYMQIAQDEIFGPVMALMKFKGMSLYYLLKQ